MMIELIIIGVSVLALLTIYIARAKTTNGNTRLFPNSFLMKTDEIIFDFIKFVFKLYALMASNLGSFFKEVPHKFLESIHKGSHALATQSSRWVDRIKGKSHSK